MAKRRPKIFVGSSSEGSKVAAAFCEKLRTVATVVFWHDSAVFRASESTLNNLIEATRTYDYGFFVFTPDDRFQSRGKEGTMGRDNVLFEFGLFLGSLGQDRAFAVVQEGETDEEKLKVPTDLWGISMPRFKKSTGDELSSEVDSSTWRIRQQIENKGPRPIRLEAALEWNFSTTTQQFSMTLAKEQLLLAKDILRDCRLCIAVRKENNGVNYDGRGH